jgi:hypothetical protein
MFSKLIKIDLHKIGLKKDDLIHLEGFSDIHYGGRNHLPKLFDRRMKAVIGDPARFTFYGGDQLDAITPKDKRWQKESVTENSLEAQKKGFYKVTQDLTELHIANKKKDGHGKVLWGLAGNHEYNNREIDQEWIQTFFEGYKDKEDGKVYDGLGVDYLGSRALIGLEIQYKGKPLRRWTILSVHGFGGGANAYTPLQNLMWNHIADVYLMGHLHQKMSMEEQMVSFNYKTGNAQQRTVVLGNTGSFTATMLDGVDQWYERRNKMKPAVAGTITISFDALKGELHHHI